jgi:hypothetical protein
MNSNFVKSGSQSYGTVQRTCILVTVLGALNKRHQNVVVASASRI